MPDLVAPLKVVLRGISKSLSPEKIMNELNKCSDATKAAQMHSRKDGRMFLLFPLNLLQNENSKKIFQITSLFKIRIGIEKYKALRKAAQCYNIRQFFHVAEDCNLNPKCVGCSDNHQYTNCPRKTEANVEKPAPVYCNCVEPVSYRDYKKYPLKHQCHKTYAVIVKKNAKPKFTRKLNFQKKLSRNHLRWHHLPQNNFTSWKNL